MKPLQVAKLLTVFGLSAASTVLLTNCNHANGEQPPPPKPTPQAGSPLCSTISQILTDKCTLTELEGGAKALNYTLTASTENVTVKVANGREPSLTINDALVYNGSLTPERLEVRRGDELRINFQNLLKLPDRFKDLGKHSTTPDGATLLDMPPQFSNLHTHGLVTAWDFNDPSKERGDNVLGILMNSRLQGIPPEVDPKSICMTTGDGTAYRYPIRADHDIGLNWYHPHPHGVSGFQLEGGMSGLLMIADEKADKLLNPIYLQLKDMQVSKQAGDNVYQFEKFVPTVAGVCHDKPLTIRSADEGWAFDSDAPGRCNYHHEPVPATATEAAKPRMDYAWLFMVNGELLPDIQLPERAYLRMINSSANATYRLALEPDAIQQQKSGTQTYYAPPFKVVEKDGTTTIDKTLTDSKTTCTLVMTPSTRVGVALDFEAMTKTGAVCELTVTVTEGSDKLRKSDVVVKGKTLGDEALKTLVAQPKPSSYSLVQKGIDTGEDDWPAVRLATLIPNAKIPGADVDAYQLALQDAAKNPVKVTERTDVKVPTDACTPTQPVADQDGVNRHLALFFGEANGGEHFGLVAAEELNQGTGDAVPVTAALIRTWRDEYLNQFADKDKALAGFDTTKNLQEYNAPNLEAEALKGLVSHKFRLEKDKPVHTNICTQSSNKPERWRIHNLSAQIHNFHLHQMKFHVADVRGSACTRPATAPSPTPAQPAAFKLVETDGYVRANLKADDFVGATDEQCVKTYAEMFHNIPASYKLVEKMQPPGTTGTASIRRESAPIPATFDYGVHDTFPVPPMGYIDIDVLFDKPEHVGEYVFHCHILEHEDAGMMGKIVVKPKPTP